MTTILEVDFNNKKLINKYIGSQKVEYYSCLCCGNKYSRTKADKAFLSCVTWSVERAKSTSQYNICKNCITQMNELMGDS